MLMLINCALGLNTPPVGTTQFVGCAIGGISVGQVMRTILAPLWPADRRFAVKENRLSDPSRVTDADYNWFSENPGIRVWEEDGRILGFSAADTRDGSIWALFVDPEHEGRGIGRALLAAACDVLRRAGHRSAVLGIDPGTRAERFYRRAGWSAESIDERGEQTFRSSL